MQITRIGLDLAKNVFEVHGVDAQDKAVLRKTLRREAVAQFFSELPPCVVGMEACSGAHYWAGVMSGLGHEVRLISPQFVTPSSNRTRMTATMRRPFAKPLAGHRCALHHQSHRSNSRYRQSIAFASGWCPAGPGW